MSSTSRKDEHLILSAWFDGYTFNEDQTRPDMAGALDRHGFQKPVLDLYTRHQAAIASMLLERIDRRLPQWSVVDADGTVQFARKLRDRSTLPERRVLASVRHLFTINWATSGPGFSWPLAYHLIWVPTYDRFVVTDSHDSDEIFGCADFALGSSPATASFVDSAGEIIREHWKVHRDQYSQEERWELLTDTGIIDEATVKAWADEVWLAAPDALDQQAYNDEYAGEQCDGLDRA